MGEPVQDQDAVIENDGDGDGDNAICMAVTSAWDEGCVARASEICSLVHNPLCHYSSFACKQQVIQRLLDCYEEARFQRKQRSKRERIKRAQRGENIVEGQLMSAEEQQKLVEQGLRNARCGFYCNYRGLPKSTLDDDGLSPFRSIGPRDMHMRAVHENKTTPCPHCSERHKRIQSHIRNKHPSEWKAAQADRTAERTKRRVAVLQQRCVRFRMPPGRRKKEAVGDTATAQPNSISGSELSLQAQGSSRRDCEGQCQ